MFTFTIVKYLDGVLRLPWNSLILHLIDITRKGIKVNLENRWITKRKQTRTVAFSDLWFFDICKTLRCSFKITLENLKQHLIDITWIFIYVLSWNWMVYKEKTCQEYTHLLTCNHMTFVKHLDRVLRLPWNSNTQHLIDIKLLIIHIIS